MAPTFNVVKMADGSLRGRFPEDDRLYSAHKRKVAQMGAGEYYRQKVTYERDGVKFRKFWSLLRFLFEHWDRDQASKPLRYKGKLVERDIESFRRDITILAGYCEKTYEVGPKGGVKVRLEPKSISYDAMEDDDFNEFYKAVINVAIKHFLPKGYKTPEQVAEVINRIERYE